MWCGVVGLCCLAPLVLLWCGGGFWDNYLPPRSPTVVWLPWWSSFPCGVVVGFGLLNPLCGVVWRGVAWRGVACVAWRGVVRCGVVWYGVV